MDVMLHLPVSLLLATALAGPAASGVPALHTRLARSEPAAGSVSASPSSLRLWFEGGIEAAFTRVGLRGSNGARFAVGAPAAGAEEGLLVAGVPLLLPPDRYTVSWETVGRDGHPIRGEFTFTVAGPAPPASAPPAVIDSSAFGAGVAGRTPARMPPASGASHDITGATEHHPEAYPPATRPVRWLHLAGLVASIGAAALLLVVVPPGGEGQAMREAFLGDFARRVRMIGLAGAALALAAACTWLWLESRMMHGSRTAGIAELTRALGTAWGRGWIVGTVGVAAVFVALLARGAGSGTPARRATIPLAVAAVVAALGPALTGHAAASTALRPLAVLADWLHVVGAGAWVGGLAAIALAGVPAVRMRPPDERAAAAAWLVTGFHRLAAPGLAIVAVSGLISMWLRVGSWSALTTTSYGGVLLFKVFAAGLAALLGAYHWKRVRPRLERARQGDERDVRQLGWSVLLELVVGAVILALTVVLVTTAPPR